MFERIVATIDRTLAPLALKTRTVVGVGLMFVLLVPVLAQLGYHAALNADSRAVIGARDDDASNAIDIAGHSRWFTSNGFYPYGPVYFRLAHVIGSGLAPLSEPGALRPVEARSKAMHYGLMVVSIGALCALTILLAGAWTSVWWARVGLSTWLAWALLHSDVWRTFLLRAHPDHLLALGVAAATWATARAWRDGTSESRRLAAWAWGLALAIKMTLLMWVPFLVLSFAFPLRRERVREMTAFAGHAALAFFAVGFPQNFGLHKIFRFLRQQSGLSMPATAESIGEWVSLWQSQLLIPLGVLLAGAFVVMMVTHRGSRGGWPGWRGLALGLGPLGVMMLQKVLAPHEHYLMPVVATQFALVGHAVAVNPLKNERVLIALMFVSALVFSFTPVVPESLGGALARQLSCRPQARALALRVDALVAEDLSIFADPYVPIASHLPKVRTSWAISADYLKANAFDALVLSWAYADRYVTGEPTDYVKRDNADWPRAVELYARFKNKEVVDLPGIGRYRRQSADDCGWEIWRKE